MIHLHFIIPPSFSAELGRLADRKLGQDYPYWLGGRFNWPAQAWLVLRQYREGVTAGAQPKAGAVNFAHVMGWREIGARQGEFRVSMRADYPRLFDVDFEILQNPAVRCTARQAYLPYWPVPGVLPRDQSRKGVATIAYAGRIGPRNLAGELRRSQGRPGGCEVRIIEPHLWHDLRDIDVLVAIRSFDKATHDNKPPSKLFSAWRAGVPLIAGYDSAFSAVGRPGVDYIRVGTEEEFLSQLQRLSSDQKAYDALVHAGRQRAREVSHEALAQVWLDCIDQRIRPAFEIWSSGNTRTISSKLARMADGLRDSASAAKHRLRAARGGR